MKLQKTVALLFSLAVVQLFTMEAQAQNFTSGVRGGFNFSTLYVDDVEDRAVRPGFHVGVYGQNPINDFAAVQLELLYTTAGNRTTYDGSVLDGTVDFNLNYVQVPLLLDLKVGNILDLHGGMYGSYLINANTSYEGNLFSNYEELDRDDFNKFDYGAVVGFGINIESMQVGVRYNLGLAEIEDSADSRQYIGDSKNVIGQVYLQLGL